MTQHAMSLMDVLAPPGNRWLMEISRRKADLPPGVQIVRFDAGGDDADDEREVVATKPRRQKKAAG